MTNPELIINLNQMAQELTIVSDDVDVYLHSKTGEYIYYSKDCHSFPRGENDDDIPGWAEDEVRDYRAIENGDDSYLMLPSAHTINEYKIMKDFCYHIPNSKLQEQLLNIIKGRGAFRRFKDSISEYGIDEDYNKFLHEALRAIAQAFCEKNQLLITIVLEDAKE